VKKINSWQNYNNKAQVLQTNYWQGKSAREAIHSDSTAIHITGRQSAANAKFAIQFSKHVLCQTTSCIARFANMTCVCFVRETMFDSYFI